MEIPDYLKPWVNSPESSAFVHKVVGDLEFGNERQLKILKKIKEHGVDYVAHLLYQHEVDGKAVSPTGYEKRLQQMPIRDAVRWPYRKRYEDLDRSIRDSFKY